MNFCNEFFLILQNISKNQDMLQRHEHLTYCRQCKHQDFDVKQGLICKLTGTLADFDPVCPNFKSISGEYGSTEFDNIRKKIDNVQNKTATQGERLANYFIDSFAIWLIAIGLIFFLSASGLNAGLSELEFYLVYFLVTVLYYTLFETYAGKTLGKFITKTRIVDENGFQPSMNTVLIRTLCRFIPFEAFSFLVSPIGWHDRISKTYVIDEDGPKSDTKNY